MSAPSLHRVYRLSDVRARGHSTLFFADMNPLFALTIEPINQPLHNNYVVTVYGITQYVHGPIHMY